MSETMVVPWDQLPSEALDGLIEEFVTRDGTDYGWQETSTEAKVAAVRAQLKRGEAVVVFDARMNSANIVHRSALAGLGV